MKTTSSIIAAHLLVLAPIFVPAAAEATVVTVAPSRDTSIFEVQPDNNFGAQNLIVGQNAQSGAAARALLEFDIAAFVPLGSTINSVVFTIGVTRQATLRSPSAYGLHEFLNEWTEGNGASGNLGSPALSGETTWNNQFHGSTAWSAAGGAPGVEYVGVASGIGPVINTRDIDYVINSTPALVSDVQSWLDDPSSNYGWFMIATAEESEGSARRFSSTEVPGSQLSPRIVIDYTAPVPEPGTALWGSGLVLAGALCRSRTRKQ